MSQIQTHCGVCGVKPRRAHVDSLIKDGWSPDFWTGNAPSDYHSHVICPDCEKAFCDPDEWKKIGERLVNVKKAVATLGRPLAALTSPVKPATIEPCNQT